MYAYGKGDVWL